MITGIPDYKPPIEQGLHCNCRTYYVVFVGGAGRFDDALCAAARARADQMHAHFVSARETPWINCYGGGALDFSNEISQRVM